MLGVCGPLQTVISEMLNNGTSMDAQLEYDIKQAIEGLERISQQFHRSWEAGAANAALHVIRRLSAPVVPTADSRAAFEAHFNLSSRQAWRTKDQSGYLNSEVQAWWKGWQAAQEDAQKRDAAD